MTYTIDEQIAEVRRELGMRHQVFPRFVDSKRITQAQADERIALLEAVQETLERVRDEQRPQLFGVGT
jgi:hypothetical protein